MKTHVDPHLYYGAVVTHRDRVRAQTWRCARVWRFVGAAHDRLAVVVWYRDGKPPEPFFCDASEVRIHGLPAVPDAMPTWACEEVAV